MLRTRVIPCLLLRNLGLVKGVGFKGHKYVGDPMNAIKIFNELEADEMMLLDIEASRKGKCIAPEHVELFASEARMPVAVGGGIHSFENAQALFKAGAEKVVLNSALFSDPSLLTKISATFGVQAVIACIDVRKNWLGRYEVVSYCGTKKQGWRPQDWAKDCQERGAGEILINSVERDGTGQGYDIELTKSISSAVTIPVIAGCGSKDLEDFRTAIFDGGASAVTAGSQFVFQGPRRAVLINFPERSKIDSVLKS